MFRTWQNTLCFKGYARHCVRFDFPVQINTMSAKRRRRRKARYKCTVSEFNDAMFLSLIKHKSLRNRFFLFLNKHKFLLNLFFSLLLWNSRRHLNLKFLLDMLKLFRSLFSLQLLLKFIHFLFKFFYLHYI